MALYLGNSEKLKINLNGVYYYINSIPLTKIVKLLSSDGYILADSSGIILVTQEDN